MNRQGQVALIVALVAVVGLTVAVSVASRSVTSISITTEEQEHARAFSAAEAGVEDALRQDLSTIVGVGGSFALTGAANTSYTVTKLTNITTDVEAGEAVTVDWSKSDAVSMDVTWVGSGCAPPLASTIIGSDGTATHAVDSAGPVNFSKEGNNRLVRLRFVGCKTRVTLTGDGTLSFYNVNSLGTSGESSSRVQVVRSEPAPAGILDYAVFSGGNVQ